MASALGCVGQAWTMADPALMGSQYVAPTAPYWSPTNAYAWYWTGKTNMASGASVNWIADASGNLGGVLSNVSTLTSVYWTNNFITTNAAMYWRADGVTRGMTNMFLSNLSTPITVVMVGNLNTNGTGAANNLVYDTLTITPANRVYGEILAGAPCSLRLYSGGTYYSPPGGFALNTPQILSFCANGTASFIRTNGLLCGVGTTAGATSIGGMTIGCGAALGANTSMAGGLCELLVYSGTMNTNDLQWAEYQLGLRYGIHTYTVYTGYQ